jgi:preprotein translocase subunit SecY
MQLLAIVIPALEKLSKEGGDEGRKKIAKITRYAAVALAAVQALGIVISWNNAGAITSVFGSNVVGCIFVGVMLVAGSMLAMWLGERITEYGIGNGTSLIIFIGILSTAGTALVNSFGTLATVPENIWTILLFIGLVVVIFGLIVWIDLSERKITVQYAKQVKGNKMFGGQNTYIPIKINASGVLPIIFASALSMFPQMVIELFWSGTDFANWWAMYLGAGTLVNTIAMPVLIIFFAFFYSQVQFNPEDIARTIQQRGGAIPSHRPGKPTVDYLRKVNTRITLFGAIFLAMISLIPSLVFTFIGADSVGLNSAFTSTGMLIIVSVALELNKQLEGQIMMRHYKGIFK